MSLALYMDQHVPRAITLGLRLAGVDGPTLEKALVRMLRKHETLVGKRGQKIEDSVAFHSLAGAHLLGRFHGPAVSEYR